MKEYRKLDDTVTMRLNRATAQFRDRDRLGMGGKGNIQDQACAHLWKELVGEHHTPFYLESLFITIENWKRRTEIVEYCVGVVDQSIDEKRKILDTQQSDASTQRRIQGVLYAEEVKVRVESTL